MLSPGKHHRAVGNTGIPPPIPSNRAKSLDVSEHHGMAEVGEDPWRELIQPFAASRVSQSLHPGPGVCLG